MKASGQLHAQPFARHLQNIVDTRFSRHGLQIHSRAPVQIEDVTVCVDQRTGRRDMLQKRVFGQLAQGRAIGCRSNFIFVLSWNSRLQRRHRW